MEPEAGWTKGAAVRVGGLKSASQHNGKTGTLKGRAGERLAVELDDGVVLSVKRANLELVEPPKAASSSSGSATVTDLTQAQRTIKKEVGLLEEFHGSADPDTLVLYHHVRDSAFDCFNASEYAVQLVQYYGGGLEVVEVVPRMLGDTEYSLVCLQDKKHAERNTLCSLAFQCKRQFCGASMLVKRRCFSCNKPDAPACESACAFWCEDESCGRDGRRLRSEWIPVREMIRASKFEVLGKEESVQLLE